MQPRRGLVGGIASTLVVVALALGATGCGSGSGSASTATSTSTSSASSVPTPAPTAPVATVPPAVSAAALGSVKQELEGATADAGGAASALGQANPDQWAGSEGTAP